MSTHTHGHAHPRIVDIGGQKIRFPQRHRPEDAPPLALPAREERPAATVRPVVEGTSRPPAGPPAPMSTDETVYEGEIVSEDVGLVDRSEVIADTGTVAERRAAYLAEAPPIIPSYLKHAEEFTEVARSVAAFYAHVSLFHATRSPIYLLRLMGRGPRGLGRGAASWLRWVTDAGARPVETRAAVDGDIQAWLALSREHSRRVRPRRVATVAMVVPSTVLVVAAVVALPWWALGAVGAALLAAAGLGGGHPDQPVITRYVSVQYQRPLDSEEVTEALEAIGIKGKTVFVNPIAVDGPGWRAEVDLPRGAVATDVLDKRAKLAAAMRRPITTVWPQTSDAHPGRLELWVAKRDPAKEPRRIWPLMREGQADVFAPLPLGWTPRGELIDVTLMYSNLLVGGIPGSGKTSAALALALGVALDPSAQLWVYELKGSGDLGSVRPVCHRYVSGDDDEDVEATVRGLRSAITEMKRRKTFVQGLPVEEVPEGRKVTRQLAAKYPGKNLDPVVLIVDEAQELFSHEDHGKEAEVLCKKLIKKARAYGIILILLTQDPDAASLPPTVSRNAGTRLCLAVMDWRANNNVLGTGAYARGLRATDISAAEVGTGILAKQRDHWTLRCAHILQTEAEEVGKRALALRIAAGTLSGEAAGAEVVDADTSTVLDHVRAVWPDGARAVHSHRLVESLAKYRPDVYGEWLGVEDVAVRSTMLAAALKARKVPTGQVTIRECCGGAKGVKLSDLPEPSGFDWADEVDDDV